MKIAARAPGRSVGCFVKKEKRGRSDAEVPVVVIGIFADIIQAPRMAQVPPPGIPCGMLAIALIQAIRIRSSIALLDIFRGICILLRGKFYRKVPEAGNNARSNRKKGTDNDKPCKRRCSGFLIRQDYHPHHYHGNEKYKKSRELEFYRGIFSVPAQIPGEK
jgi:hypothetical protein